MLTDPSRSYVDDIRRGSVVIGCQLCAVRRHVCGDCCHRGRYMAILDSNTYFANNKIKKLKKNTRTHNILVRNATRQNVGVVNLVLSKKKKKKLSGLRKGRKKKKKEKSFHASTAERRERERELEIENFNIQR